MPVTPTHEQKNGKSTCSTGRANGNFHHYGRTILQGKTHRGDDLLCRSLPQIGEKTRHSGVNRYTARRLGYRAISGNSARQSIAWVRRIAPDRPRNNLRCRVSSASANTPPTTVRRNGSAHSPGL